MNKSEEVHRVKCKRTAEQNESITDPLSVELTMYEASVSALAMARQVTAELWPKSIVCGWTYNMEDDYCVDVSWASP